MGAGRLLEHYLQFYFVRFFGMRKTFSTFRIRMCVVLGILFPIYSRTMVSLMLHETAGSSLITGPKLEHTAHDAKLSNETCGYRKPNGKCFDLWVAEDSTPSDLVHPDRIFVVVSHCLHDLRWLQDFLAGFQITSVTVYSKCNASVIGAPSQARVIRLENVGRCDHSYARWMARVPEYIVPQTNDVVVFLKDDLSTENIHQNTESWKSFSELLQLAIARGFSCGQRPSRFENGTFSSFHSSPHLLSFQFNAYGHNSDKYENSPTVFKSRYPSMKEWLISVGAHNLVPPDLAQVCYGGVFATRLERVLLVKSSIWSGIETSLARGNNIEEGHFAERAFAPLLSVPLSPKKRELLWKYSSSVMEWYGAYMGTLVKSSLAAK
jgi:hypothetical protein